MLNWNDIDDASITHYQYQLRKPKFDETYGPWINIPVNGASTTEYTITGLKIDTLYNIRLRACNFLYLCGANGKLYHVRPCAATECEPVKITLPPRVFTPTNTPWPGFWFYDDDGSIHEAAIETLAAAGATRGCRPRFYCPTEQVTRGQFASLLARALSLRPDGKDYFSDDNSSVHEAAVNALAAAGATRGCRPRFYCPTEQVTRGQMATMLARALPGPAPDDAEDYFGDVDGSVHEAAVNALAAAGVISGCGPGSFCPADPVRRDHAAAILARALGLQPAPIASSPWRLELIADGIDGGPTDLQAPTGDDRAFFTTKPGMIYTIANGAVSPEPFLDLTHKVKSAGAEQGLLGLAFHPDYAANRKFFVFYTDHDNHSQIYQYQADPQNPDRADPATARRIITFEQTSDLGFHLGGQLQFGPDGYLYIAVGYGDFSAEAQNPRTALGTIVRIDVDNGDPYSIPADNPYADDQAGLPEIWAYGLRNPWRFSFDDPHIYIADVGGAGLEEINIADASERAINYGWPTMEGTGCNMPSNCNTHGLFNPQITYPRNEGVAVIGGYVYRGHAIPEMNGHYFYSDFSGQWIRTFLYDNGQITQQQQWPRPDQSLTTRIRSYVTVIYSFGTDSHGELYILTRNSIHKIVPAVASVP